MFGKKRKKAEAELLKQELQRKEKEREEDKLRATQFMTMYVSVTRLNSRLEKLEESVVEAAKSQALEEFMH